jgi:hypothetical protein
MIKLLIGIIFLAILVSLGVGAVALVNDKGHSKKLVNSLTARVLLSVLLFVLLIIAYLTGLIHPHGIIPAVP